MKDIVFKCFNVLACNMELSLGRNIDQMNNLEKLNSEVSLISTVHVEKLKENIIVEDNMPQYQK